MKYLCKTIIYHAGTFGTVALWALLLGFSTTSWAQEDTADVTEDEAEIIEEIIVTGSRLRRDRFNVSTHPRDQKAQLTWRESR